jgi:transketolase N-terminal domain/subunit
MLRREIAGGQEQLTMTNEPIGELARRARCRLLQLHFEAGVGHIGGKLSALYIMLILHHGVGRTDDRFSFSKCHAVWRLHGFASYRSGKGLGT